MSDIPFEVRGKSPYVLLEVSHPSLRNEDFSFTRVRHPCENLHEAHV